MDEKIKDTGDDCGCPEPDGNMGVQKTVNLAIQGGGAHGAFAWGVIDKIIEDGRIGVEGLSATSAGSMNAVVYAYGNMTGGPDGAREALHNFWKNVSDAGAVYSPLKRMPWDYLLDKWNMDYSMPFTMFEMMTRTFSPYQFNPFNFNPLRDILEKSVNFDVLRRCQQTRLFLSATNIRTGKVRVFTTNEVNMDVVLASACLPFLYQAVKIGDEHYWDGGYMGNPALFPLFYHTDSRDVVIIHINPIEREDLPIQSNDIIDRVNEITFNSSLLKEMRSIAFVTKLLEDGWLKDEFKDKLKHLLMHSIRSDDALSDLKVASKFNSEWPFLTHLRDLGREAAAQWLEKNYDSIGRESTVDLKKEFLDLGVEHAG